MEQREYWLLPILRTNGRVVSGFSLSRDDALAHGKYERQFGNIPQYLIHVRLKPKQD